jgi:5-formyltetrahydrofolate cyclo-ligase
MQSATSSHDLRQTLRARRRSLDASAQVRHSEAVAQQLIARSGQGQRIAVYLAFDGEVNLQPFIQWCWAQQIETFLPVLDPQNEGHLLFQPFTQNTAMVKNKFNIAEPEIDYNHTIPVTALDMLAIPLVGFDRQANRMGMGGGFYDRTLASVATLSVPNQRPHLIGIAHSIQEVQTLTVQSWDIPMDDIITEQTTISRARS